MDKIWEVLQKALLAVLDFALFIFASIFFIPSFFIVTYTQDYWSKKLNELFGL